MMLNNLFTHIGSFGVGSAASLCLGLLLLLAYHLKVRQIRRRGRRLLRIELRLEAAWQNARVVSKDFVPKPHPGLAGVFVGGLTTGIKGRVLSMRPLDPALPGTLEMQQTGLRPKNPFNKRNFPAIYRGLIQ